MRVRKKNPNGFLRAALIRAQKIDPSIKGLRLYRLNFRWDEYKKSRLQGASQPVESILKRERLIEILN